MTNQIAVPAELTNQLAIISTTLATIEAEQNKLAAQKAETLEAQARLILVVAYLNGSAPLPATLTKSGRAPMSAQAKENIRVGLERARLSKAAEKASAALESTSTPSPVAPVAEPIPAPASPAATKATKKGAGK
jgi:hypothetical protein